MSKNVIKKEFVNFKPNKDNTFATKHFIEGLGKKRGISLHSGANISNYIRDVFRRIRKDDVLIQKFKGKDRIIVSIRNMYIVVSYESFIKEKIIVLITLLKGKMRLGGTIKKNKMTQRKQTRSKTYINTRKGERKYE